MSEISAAMCRQLRRSAAALALTVTLILAGASTVSAHIGVLPGEVPADTNQAFTVRVPNERPEATVKVRVEFPAEIVVSRFQPKPGWTREIERDEQQRIIAVTWTGGQIGDGEYDDFSFMARTPKETGSLAFKSYQTYSNGETVAWVNPQGQERSGAFVEVKPATAGSH